MKKLVVLLLIVFTTSVYAQVQPAKEVRAALRGLSIAEKDYLIGIGHAPQANLNAKKQARESAMASIYTKVVEDIRNVILATRDASGHSNISEYYSTVAQKPKVSVRLPRIQDVQLSPGYRYNSNVYAVVAVRRDVLKAYYTKEANALRTKIADNIAQAQNAIDPERAAELYLQTYADYEALKHAELITLGTEYELKAEAVLAELQSYKDSMGNHSQEYVSDEVSDFFQKHYALTSVADIATIIAEQFETQQANTSGEPVQLDMFTSGISEISPSFSLLLNSALTAELGKKWPIVSSAAGASLLGIAPTAKLRLSGTYWDIGGNHMTIRAALRDVTTGTFQAATVLRFNRKNLKEPDGIFEVDENVLAGLTADAEEALDNRSLVRRLNTSTETLVAKTQPESQPTVPEIGNSYDSLEVKIRTNKGEQSQVVEVGEKLDIFVKVNQPAHVRLLSVLPGEKWTQLAKDMHIRPEQIDRWVPVPGNFVVFPPEGQEQYRAIARLESNGPFEAISEYFNEGPYRYIGARPQKTGDPDIRLAHAKGLRRASKGTGNIDWTTGQGTKGTANTDFETGADGQGTKGTANTNFETGADSTAESSKQDADAEKLANIEATDAYDVLFVRTVKPSEE